MKRAALVMAGLYAVGIGVYWYLDDPFITRDSTFTRCVGCPPALPRYRSAS